MIRLIGLAVLALAGLMTAFAVNGIPLRVASLAPSYLRVGLLVALFGAIGALIVGVLLLQAGLIPNVAFPMPLPDLLVWALVFGAAQQTVTAAVDSRIRGLVTPAAPPRHQGLRLGGESRIAEVGAAPAEGRSASERKETGTPRSL